MVVLYIVLGILLFLFLILLFPLYLKVDFESGKDIDGKVGFLFFSIPLSGEKKKEPKEEKKIKKEEPSEKSPPKKEKKKLSEIIDIIKILLSQAAKLGRRKRISNLYISATIAEEDAYKTAMKFGEYNALVFGLLAFAKNLFKIKKEKIDLMPDFSGNKEIYKIKLTIKLTGLFVFIAAIRILKELFMSETNKRKEEDENASD
ncbi:MAG: DUF2953 domain-containing protein [Oscillospiraceae bacterium]|nr:DUF2953 domain-containing protein [Oscillospiraceae bacterium]